MGQQHRFGQALAFALCLHGAALLLMRLGPPTATSLGLITNPASTSDSVELDLTDVAPTQTTPSSQPGATLPAEPTRRSSARPATLDPEAQLTGLPSDVGTELPSGATATLNAGISSTDTAQTGTAAAPSALPEAPRLSLQALGILGGIRESSPTPETGPVDGAARAEQRLETTMSQAVLDHDQQLGLHAAGPLLKSLHDSVGNSRTPTNSRAVFSAIVGADGRITSLEIVESEGARDAWEEVVKRVRALLAGRVMQLAKNPRGLQLIVEVVSREQLPSGADPGFGVKLAGIPLKKGKGKKSTSISLLGAPKIVERTIKIGEDDVKVPQLEWPIIDIKADPSDIGAQARRMVHTRLLKQRAL